MSNETCSSSLETGSFLYPVALHLISIALTSRALQIQHRLREMFHPFFSMLLFLVLLSYIICNVFAIISCLLAMSYAPAITVVTSNYIYAFIYFYINGMMFCCVVERLVATVLMKTYEYNRRWWAMAFSQPFAICLAIGNLLLHDTLSKVIALISLYALNILCLVILLFVNYRITTALTGTGAALSTRYQINENIRTIRVLLPTVLCDALVSVTDSSGALLFNYHHVFQPTRCAEEHYIAVFYGFTTVSAIFEFLMPCSLLLSHPAYRRHSLMLYERHPVHLQHAAIIKDKTLPKVINVLGIEIANPGEQAYFENLSRVWNLRL